MKILVLAEINNGELAEDQTSKTVSAATTLGKVDVCVLPASAPMHQQI